MAETEATSDSPQTNNQQLNEEESEIDKVNKQNENKKLHDLLMFNTIYYILVFVIVGLPIWFFTTSTYRASLPFDSIDKLTESLQKIDFKIQVELIHFNKDISQDNLSKIRDELLRNLNKNSKQKGLVLNFDLKTRKATSDEYNSALGFRDIQTFDENIANKNLNILNLIVLDSDLSKKYEILDNSEFLFLNSLLLNEINIKNLEKIAEYLKKQYLHLEKINEEYRLKLDTERRLPSKKDLKVVNFDSEYEITFSLINEIPEKYSNWNIDECIRSYFLKVTDQLSQFVNFSIKAQTLLYSDFGSYSLSSYKSDNDPFFYLKQTDLSIMTNYIESRLGSRISDSSAFEFVTYISAKQPLYVATNSQNPQETKSVSFMVPRWGGIYVYNPQDDNPEDSTIKVDKAMKTFLTHFITLMGIDLNKNSKTVPRSRIYSPEIYGYLLEKTLENQLNSINTLRSLSLLLTRINSMVIEDDIAEQVKIAVESVEKSLELGSDGRISEAFLNSKTAFISSERAFFDKSLLEKLYFPEDQRFAIYIPLFIPVGIPLVLSIKSVMAWIKSKKEKKD
ncbi:unnamed protein product [Brachionus calyciflorus]|uniref:GPI transamidase component PIG-S n=1 Tax=Brachionus calyciflorus TaxID=104777 RepID=A0A813TA98_9BILA|nr:unnamed protein product [Brachionus calyciflorus]